MAFPEMPDLDQLGSLVFDKGVGRAFSNKIAEIKRLTDKLHLIEPHQALYILNKCPGVKKAMYLLRMSTAWKAPPVLASLDELMRASVERITNTEMSPEIWKRASMPIR